MVFDRYEKVFAFQIHGCFPAFRARGCIIVHLDSSICSGKAAGRQGCFDKGNCDGFGFKAFGICHGGAFGYGRYGPGGYGD